MSTAPLAAFAAGVLSAIGLAELAMAFAARSRTGRAQRAGRLGRCAAATLPLLAALGRRVRLPGAPADLSARIAAGGSDAAVADVMALKAGAGLAGLGGALVLAPTLPGRLGLLAPAAVAAAAFLAPDVVLKRRITARRRAMSADFPDMLDLLRVALAAGLTVNRALAEVGRRHPGSLASELRRAARRFALGAPRHEVMAELERRVPLPQAPALVATLERAARHGVPPDAALLGLATSARADATRAVTESAARAAPQIQLVVALGLVPAALLLVAAALLPSLA